MKERDVNVIKAGNYLVSAEAIDSNGVVVNKPSATIILKEDIDFDGLKHLLLSLTTIQKEKYVEYGIYVTLFVAL